MIQNDHKQLQLTHNNMRKYACANIPPME